MPLHSTNDFQPFWGTFGRLRYTLGGDRPSQTPPDTVSRDPGRISIQSGRYPTSASTKASAPVSMAPAYPVQTVPKFNIRLQ